MERWQELNGEILEGGTIPKHAGTVRLRIVPDACYEMDNLKGDCFNPEVNTDIDKRQLAKEERDFEQKVSREGVWGVIAEFYNLQSQTWEYADSCFGFIGDDWNNSDCTYDLKASAIAAYENSLHQLEWNLLVPGR